VQMLGVDVLAMVVVIVGLILWPFIDAILLSTTTLNFTTGDGQSGSIALIAVAAFTALKL